MLEAGSRYWFELLFFIRCFLLLRVELKSEDKAKGPSGKYMVLDGITVRNLEILVNNTTGGSEGTLLGRVDSCNTAMGRRTLRHWVVAPLLQVSHALLCGTP